MNKLLFIPLDYQYNPYQEFYKSLSKKFDALYYSDNETAITFNPDYIYGQFGAISLDKMIELKEKTGAFIALWTGDVREWILPEVLLYKDVCDLVLLASGIGQKEMYENELKRTVRYFQHHVSSFIEAKNLTDGKIVFIGNSYSQFEGAVERNNLCELLTAKFPQFEVWGDGFSLPQYRNPGSILKENTPPLYNNSYISISANIYNNIEGYFSDRPLNIMAAGSCCLMRYVPKLERFFDDMKHCVFYKNNDEAIDKINYLIANPDERNRIAKQGQGHVMKFYSDDYAVIELIEYFNQFT